MRQQILNTRRMSLKMSRSRPQKLSLNQKAKTTIKFLNHKLSIRRKLQVQESRLPNQRRENVTRKRNKTPPKSWITLCGNFMAEILKMMQPQGIPKTTETSNLPKRMKQKKVKIADSHLRSSPALSKPNLRNKISEQNQSDKVSNKTRGLKREEQTIKSKDQDKSWKVKLFRKRSTVRNKMKINLKNQDQTTSNNLSQSLKDLLNRTPSTRKRSTLLLSLQNCLSIDNLQLAPRDRCLKPILSSSFKFKTRSTQELKMHRVGYLLIKIQRASLL